jgi:ribosomal protein S18 acetylase RimI-like enzyme
MQIVTLESAHVDAVVALYRTATREVPHCRFTRNPQALAAVLRHATPEQALVLVATEAGIPLGMVALADQGETVDGRRTAAVTALFVGHMAAGHLLIEAAMAWAQARGVRRLFAFPPTHFHCPVTGYNGGWDGLSDRVGLVGHLLARHGFTPFHRELHLEYTGTWCTPDPIPALPGISVVRRIEARGQAVIAALHEGREAGTCEYSRLTRISDEPEAAQWGYIWGLEVLEGMRRKGIGRYLLHCALSDLSAQGCRGCWLTTDAANWPAQALYLALCFVVVDGSTCFRKDLQVV